MNISPIADLWFLIISLIFAIHHAFKEDSSMYFCFVIIAYLLVRQGIHDVKGD